jgi:hypothetical protein
MRSRALRTFIRFGARGEGSNSVAMHLERSPKPARRVPEYLNVSMAAGCVLKNVTALIASCHFAVPNALLIAQRLTLTLWNSSLRSC